MRQHSGKVDHAEPYKDDIRSHTFGQHLVDLESTFLNLEKSNVQMRMEKCYLFSFNRVYCHVISEGS